MVAFQIATLITSLFLVFAFTFGLLKGLFVGGLNGKGALTYIASFFGLLWSFFSLIL